MTRAFLSRFGHSPGNVLPSTILIIIEGDRARLNGFVLFRLAAARRSGVQRRAGRATRAAGENARAASPLQPRVRRGILEEPGHDGAIRLGAG